MGQDDVPEARAESDRAEENQGRDGGDDFRRDQRHGDQSFTGRASRKELRSFERQSRRDCHQRRNGRRNGGHNQAIDGGPAQVFICDSLDETIAC